MFVAQKKHLNPRSFRHRIRDGVGSYFDFNHFLGLDPMDHTWFQSLYHTNKRTKKGLVLKPEDTGHLISNL